MEYTKQQYLALVYVFNHLKTIYPALISPDRILGHEHVAGWRGKADPGIMFDWNYFYEQCFPNQTIPYRGNVCPPDLKISLEKFLKVLPVGRSKAIDFWHALSHITETSVRLFERAKLPNEKS
jgi:hypothetical protein